MLRSAGRFRSRINKDPTLFCCKIQRIILIRFYKWMGLMNLYIIVAGWEFGGLIFIFWDHHIQYGDPWNAVKLSINGLKWKSIYTQWESLFSEKIKQKKHFFGPKSYGTKKGVVWFSKCSTFEHFWHFIFNFSSFFHFWTFWDPLFQIFRSTFEDLY